MIHLFAQAASAATPSFDIASIGEKVLISVLSSAATLLFVTFGKTFWEAKVYPWILKTFRENDQSVNGTWICNYQADVTNQTAVDRLTLNQFGHLLKGEFEYTLTDNATKTTDVTIYKMHGQLKNDYVVLYYTPKDRNAKGLGSLTLQIINNGRGLKGMGAVYATNRNIIDSQDFEYQKVSDTV